MSVTFYATNHFWHHYLNNEALNRKYLVLIKIIGHSISIQV